ncbi:MAG: zinc-dependent metalloprotease [Chloroflexaceae bacterium]|nr:zinc-dependent metalloprotease [Chloroflexaceae bacterium]
MHTAQTSPPQPLIDWDRARKVALKVSRWEQAPLHDRAYRQAQYARIVAQCEPRIAEYLGVSLPQPITRVYVLDRREWLEANFSSFEQLLAPIEEIYQRRARHRGGVNLLAGDIQRSLLSVQTGVLLGFLGRRVLGQYDLSLLSPDPSTQGSLYYVEPNIKMVQAGLGLSDEEFRLWIALHETTHVFEFEAYPWVLPHFRRLIRDYFDQVSEQVDTLGSGLWRLVGRVGQHMGSRGGVERLGRSLWHLVSGAEPAPGGDNTHHWIEMVLTDEQRRIFDQLQALMSLVEGYSNHIMNAVGKQLLPSFALIEQRMEQRKRSRPLMERIFYRLTGMDLKLVQYEQGETFVATVVRERGMAFASQVWEGAENLPTLEEIRHPQQWIERIECQKP